MSTNQIIVWVVIALVVLGGGFLLLSGSNDSGIVEDDTMMEGEAKEKDSMMKDEEVIAGSTEKEDGTMMEEDSMMKEDEGAMMQKGTYAPYAPEKLALANEGNVVLFFKADWCPTCRALDADIRANLSDLPTGLSILTLNYDTETALKQKYGVTYQHTLVQVSSDGTQLKKWSGSMTLAALTAEVQ